MTEEKTVKLFKTVKWILTVAIVLFSLFFVISAVAFVPMLFLNEHMTVEAGGLLGFFIEVLREGEVAISSRELGLIILPRLTALFLMLVFLVQARGFAKRGEKASGFAFPNARKKLVSLSVTSFLLTLLPQVLTGVAERNVTAIELFNITETDRSGWLALGFVLLFFSLTFVNKVSEKNEEPTEQAVQPTDPKEE